MMITGFEPLDLIIMESAEKADKIIDCIRESDHDNVVQNFNSLIEEMQVDILEDLTGNDLRRINTELQKKGYSLYRY